jgi:hypothetical protein
MEGGFFHLKRHFRLFNPSFFVKKSAVATVLPAVILGCSPSKVPVGAGEFCR